MAHLIIAADLGALREAAASIGGSTGSGSGAAPRSVGANSLGHDEGDAAVADFHTAMHQHTRDFAGRAAQGAAAMHGYFIAFHEAGD